MHRLLFSSFDAPSHVLVLAAESLDTARVLACAKDRRRVTGKLLLIVTPLYKECYGGTNAIQGPVLKQACVRHP